MGFTPCKSRDPLLEAPARRIMANRVDIGDLEPTDVL